MPAKDQAQPSQIAHYNESRQPPEAMLWPDEQRGPWLIRAHWGNSRTGRPECVQLEVRSYRMLWERWAKALPLETSEETLPITAELWRSIPVASVIAALRERKHVEVADWTAQMKGQARQDPGYEVWADVAEMNLRLWEIEKSADASTLEKVAAVYRAALADGQNPTQKVADHFVISHSAAAKRVARARKAELLPATSRGRPAGGPLTDERKGGK